MTLSRSTGGCVNVLYKDTTLDGYTANGVLHVVIYSNGRTRISLRASTQLCQRFHHSRENI